MHDHDLVIRGGTVIDGTGAPRRSADVAVDGGRITAVGEVAGSGREEIDASDRLVTPGFVDVHTHYDGQVTWDGELAPSSWQGVTTAVMGNCGVGFAPVAPERREWLIALMEGIEDIPGTVLHEGMSWEWETFPEYLDAVDRRRFTIDVAAQVPHTAVRGYVMGDRGADHQERPTDDEIAAMGRIVAEAVQAGALGFTTSRTVNHKDRDGRLTPSLTAEEAELLGIAAAMGRTGQGVFEVVCDFGDFEREFALLRAMSAVSGRPMSITAAQLMVNPPGHWQRLLHAIEQAVADGVPLRGQVAARPVGLIMSLEGRVHPLVVSPTYQSLAARPLAERVAALRQPDTRAAILAEVRERGPLPGPGGQFDLCFALGATPRYDVQPADSLAATAAARGIAPEEAAYDALLDCDGEGAIYVPVANFSERNLDITRALLAHPLTVPGLGDGGAHCTMICDASFPTYLLTYWGRDAAPELRLPLEEVVARQTSTTAHLVGLHDRGVLAPGMRADLNVIDLDRLAIGRPEMIRDLPAGGKRLVQRTTGFDATVTAGEVTFRDGVATGARPGRLVRGAQPAPLGR
jgi:N-acyl-D-aspartate/D-glutamate deacylase